MDTPLQRLRQALEAQRQALDKLEGALRGFEETLPAEASGRPDGRAAELLSMAEVCTALGMGKSWTYRRVKSGEIPSVKLGRSTKVRRENLDEYLESHRYRPEEAE
jgi:excisionase family DNA binding protein